ncbi:MAG: hypothetical protein ABJO54_07400 [Hyphomicrobiales bacterium]
MTLGGLTLLVRSEVDGCVTAPANVSSWRKRESVDEVNAKLESLQFPAGEKNEVGFSDINVSFLCSKSIAIDRFVLY